MQGSNDTHCHAGQQQPGLAQTAGCQKQTAPSGPLPASIHQMVPPKRGGTHPINSFATHLSTPKG